MMNPLSTFLCALSLAAAAFADTRPTVSVAAADKPNIILVMADDQGWGDESKFLIPAPNENQPFHQPCI